MISNKFIITRTEEHVMGHPYYTFKLKYDRVDNHYHLKEEGEYVMGGGSYIFKQHKLILYRDYFNAKDFPIELLKNIVFFWDKNDPHQFRFSDTRHRVNYNNIIDLNLIEI